MNKQAMIKTELGLLPSDWKIESLKELFKTFPSASFSREEMEAEEGVACVHYGDIHKRFGKIVNLDEEKLPLVTSEQAHRYKLLKDGDLLADASEDDEGIGKSIIVLVGKHPAIAGLHTIPLRVKTNDIDTCFPTYLFAGKLVKRQIEKLSEGTKVNSITFNKICNVFLPIPPTKDEQKRIATALYDIDTLLRNLDRTIEKKQNIRQGAMEQLLSGKKRLPGFKREWKLTILKDIADMYSGGTPKSSEPSYYENGNINFLSISDMTSAGKFIVKTEKRITRLGLDNSSARVFPSGTLMFAMYASLGKCSISTIETAISQAILGFILSDSIDRDFLYYYSCSIEDKVKNLGQQGTQSNLSKAIVEGIELYIPTDLQEQRAIADTLTAMDDEIAVLQMERDKYANIRSGMMDDLLTGAKRL